MICVEMYWPDEISKLGKDEEEYQEEVLKAEKKS